MRQQLGLHLCCLGEPLRQYLRNALVVLLPRAPKQRLVRCVLDQRMLEHICSLGGHTSLGDQLGLDQLRERLLECHFVERRHSLHQVIGEGASNDRA